MRNYYEIKNEMMLIFWLTDTAGETVADLLK
jgi:hypothetical protein